MKDRTAQETRETGDGTDSKTVEEAQLDVSKPGVTNVKNQEREDRHKIAAGEKKPRQNISVMKVEEEGKEGSKLTDKQRKRYQLEGWLVAILLVIAVLIAQIVRKNSNGDKDSLLDNQYQVVMVSNIEESCQM